MNGVILMEVINIILGLWANLTTSSYSLTPAPISIGDTWTAIHPEKPLKAANEGARIVINVTKQIVPSGNIIDDIKKGRLLFPKGCVEIRLYRADGQEISLEKGQFTVSSDKHSFLMLGSDGTKKDDSFQDLRIKSSCPIEGASIEWSEAGK